MKRVFLPGCTLLVLFVLVACGSTPSTPTPVDVSSLQTHAVETAYADLTRNAPTKTFTPTVTPTFTPTLTPTITPTPTEVKLSTVTNLTIYMVNIIDQETCRYETLPIPVNRGITGDMFEDVRFSVAYLLNTKWNSSGYLTNPLATSNLYFTSVEMLGNEMKITLGGNMSRYDDQCLNSEARDQLWATVWTAVRRYEQPIVTTISIWVNDILFDDVMLRG
jgi:hypothetical protein